MRKVMITVVALALFSTSTASSAQAGSIFGTLVGLAQIIGEYLDDDIFILNNTDGHVVFYVRAGDGTWIGQTGASPWSLAPPIDGILKGSGNPRHYEIMALVYNPNNGQWVDRTGWVRIENPDPWDDLNGNPGDDLYFELFRNARGAWKIQLLQ